ncbi:TIR domain-containing protein, partial [bacterium]|nr:TIR domain-containing protein [bacterium]
MWLFLIARAGFVILPTALLSWATSAHGNHIEFSSILSYALLVYLGLSYSAGPLLLLLLFWKRATKAGVFASVIFGTVACIIWVVLRLNAVTGLREMMIGFGISMVVMIVVSLFTRSQVNADILMNDILLRHKLRRDDTTTSIAQQGESPTRWRVSGSPTKPPHFEGDTTQVVMIESPERQGKEFGSKRSVRIEDEEAIADCGQVERIETPETASRKLRAPKSKRFGDIPPENLTQFSHAQVVQHRTPLYYPSSFDRVDCSIFAPPTVAPRRTIMIQVFAHIEGEVQQAAALARGFDTEARHRAIQNLEVVLAPEDRLTFELAATGLQIDDPIQHLVWHRVTRAVQFAVTAPANAQPHTVIVKLTVSRRTVPVGHMKFKLEIVSRARDMRPDQPLGDIATRYHKAFVSYASSDRAEVIKRVQMLRMMRIDFFQDVLSLAPGARWKQGLYYHIDECDLFLLFWSHAAKQSEWVQKEIDYALRLKGGDDYAPPEIQPVLIEGPP